MWTLWGPSLVEYVGESELSFGIFRKEVCNNYPNETQVFSQTELTYKAIYYENIIGTKDAS